MNVNVDTPTKYILIFLGACLVLLQLAAISQRSFWEDETVTATLGPLDFGTIIQARAANNHPPLYWLSAALWGRLFGFGEWSLKSYSLIWLLSAFFLVVRLADLLYDRRTAVIATTLLTFSPYILTYGHNARYYAMSAAISLFAAWMAKNYLEYRRWIDLVLYTVAGVALLYTIYMGAALLIAINLWYLAAAVSRKFPLRRVAGWILAQLIIVLCYLPWMSILFGAVGRNLDQSPLVGNLAVELITRFGYLGYAYLNGEFLSPLNPLVWMMVLLFILISVFTIGRTFRKSWLPLSVVLVCLTLSVVVNIVSVYPQSAWQNLSNRTFFVFPFFLIWLAGNLAQLRPKLTYLSLGIIFVVNVAGISNYFSNAQMAKPILAVPWIEIMQTIRTEKLPDGVVLCSQGDSACPFYLDRFGLEGTESWTGEKVLKQTPADLWWIQINLGAPKLSPGQSVDLIDRFEQVYQHVSIENYAPQDRSIRIIKSDIFGQVDYEFRVSLYHFTSPLQP